MNKSENLTEKIHSVASPSVRGLNDLSSEVFDILSSSSEDKNAWIELLLKLYKDSFYTYTMKNSSYLFDLGEIDQYLDELHDRDPELDRPLRQNELWDEINKDHQDFCHENNLLMKESWLSVKNFYIRNMQTHFGLQEGSPIVTWMVFAKVNAIIDWNRFVGFLKTIDSLQSFHWSKWFEKLIEQLDVFSDSSMINNPDDFFLFFKSMVEQLFKKFVESTKIL